MAYYHDLGGTRHSFADLRGVMAAASPHRSGDVLAGVAAASAEQRVAARLVLADLPLASFLADLVIPYEADEVTRLIIDSHDENAFAAIAHLTVGGLRDWLLSNAPKTDRVTILAVSGWPPILTKRSLQIAAMPTAPVANVARCGVRNRGCSRASGPGRNPPRASA